MKTTSCSQTDSTIFRQVSEKEEESAVLTIKACIKSMSTHQFRGTIEDHKAMNCSQLVSRRIWSFD